jgi:hypothetical protein
MNMYIKREERSNIATELTFYLRKLEKEEHVKYKLNRPK